MQITIILQTTPFIHLHLLAAAFVWRYTNQCVDALFCLQNLFLIGIVEKQTDNGAWYLLSQTDIQMHDQSSGTQTSIKDNTNKRSISKISSLTSLHGTDKCFHSKMTQKWCCCDQQAFSSLMTLKCRPSLWTLAVCHHEMTVGKDF